MVPQHTFCACFKCRFPQSKMAPGSGCCWIGGVVVAIVLSCLTFATTRGGNPVGPRNQLPKKLTDMSLPQDILSIVSQRTAINNDTMAIERIQRMVVRYHLRASDVVAAAPPQQIPSTASQVNYTLPRTDNNIGNESQMLVDDWTFGSGTASTTLADFVAHGCNRVSVETLHPGGLGAALMRVVFGVRDHWLLGNLTDATDYVADMSLFSYQCTDSVTWSCYFNDTLPCTTSVLEPPSAGKLAYSRVFRKKLRAVWVRAVTVPDAPEPGLVLAPAKPSAAAAAVGAIRNLDTFQQLRWIAASLFHLAPSASRRIDARLKRLGFDPRDGNYLSVHFRRGDKTREARDPPSSGSEVVNFVKNKWGAAAPIRVFVLTDDASVLGELRTAAPEWQLYSFADGNNRGFNECLLPTIRVTKKEMCNCTEIARVAKSGTYPTNAKRRSYCFVNPDETDPTKLMSVEDVPDMNPEESGVAMLADVLVATRSKFHVAAGCGSNVDKLVHLLRTDDADKSVCIAQRHRECTVNVFRWSANGIKCKAAAQGVT